jgi:hypothetical protein
VLSCPLQWIETTSEADSSWGCPGSIGSVARVNGLAEVRECHPMSIVLTLVMCMFQPNSYARLPYLYWLTNYTLH